MRGILGAMGLLAIGVTAALATAPAGAAVHTATSPVCFSIHDNGAWVYGSLFTTHLSVRDAAPEPATWGLMLAGFGLVGAMLRRPSGLRVLTS